MLHAVNLALKWVTLSIYHFWGKTRIREYLWSQQSYDGDRFEYTGCGTELFKGFIKAGFAMIGLIIGAFYLLPQVGHRLDLVFILPAVIFSAAGYFLMAIAGYTARGYLLSRTRWRSIRFSQSESAAAYAGLALGHGLLTILTIGLYWPIRRHILLGYKINNTWFGRTRFSYNGNGKDLLGKFLLSYLLTIPTLGLCWYWYMARDAEYVASHTHLQNVHFRLEYTGGQLLWLRASNLFLSLITFGFAYPWITLRNIQFLFGHLRITGMIDYKLILQSIEEADKTGEGLAEIFGFSGSFLGLGRI
jgi:uncharacterized membrane protein YjgN (DUF898 family)